ncbi:hypothetical protein A4X09_0g684 [Tilletia walkeri]|uniref:PSP1 C-terminal domain-containing protein n=1 Tax=Tilletia walkeri TaxID=117179 RepID=A0A8X7T7T3_9BASI|nr:hypothetical protein A4X09_0g684 [Tilletia walkeri]
MNGTNGHHYTSGDYTGTNSNGIPMAANNKNGNPSHFDPEDYSRGRPADNMRFNNNSGGGGGGEGFFSPTFSSSAGASASNNAFASGSPFSSHSRESSMGNGAFGNGAAPRDSSPFRDNYNSPRSTNMQPQRAIGFEVGRAVGNGHPSSVGGDFSSRGSSLGPVARPQPGPGSSMPRTASAIGPGSGGSSNMSSGYGSSSSSFGFGGGGGGGGGGSGQSSALGSLAITDEDLLGDLESLNFGGGAGAGNNGPYGHASSSSSVLARVQYDTAQIQQHPSVRVPSNHAAQTGVHAASVPSGFGLGQLWGHNSSGNIAAGNGSSSVYGSSAGSNSSSSYGGGGGGGGIPAEMSASTSSHLFHRSSNQQQQQQQHHMSPHLSHHHASSTGSNSSAAAAAAAEYLRGGSPYGAGGNGGQQHMYSSLHQFHGHSHGHGHGHGHAHPLSASWNDSGAVTPGTSAPPAPGARMHELAERLHRHQHQQVQGHGHGGHPAQIQHVPIAKSKHVAMPSRDLGGASWGTSGSPTALGGLGTSTGAGGGAGGAAAAMAAALGRSPASTSGLGRRVAPRSGSHSSISRRSLGGEGGGAGSVSDFDAQSSHSESDWVDDDGPEEGVDFPGGATHGNNGSMQYHHHHHHPQQQQQQHAHHHPFQNGRDHHQMGGGYQGEGARGEEYEEGEEGMGGAGSRTPTARTSRHPLGAFTSLSGISAAAAAAAAQSQHQPRGGVSQPPPLSLPPLDAQAHHALAAHGLSDLTIATLAALGAGGAGAADIMGAFGGQGHGGGHGMTPSGSFGMHPGFGGGGGSQPYGAHQHQQGGGGPTSFAGPGVAELGKGVPLQTLAKDTPLYIVEFKQGRKEVFFAPDLQQQQQHLRERERISNGDLVIVEADRGKDLGTVVTDSLTVEQVQAYLLHHSEVLQAQLNAQQHAEGGGPLPPGGVDNASGGGQQQQQPSNGPPGSEMPMYARLARSIHPKRLYGKASANDTSLLLTKAQDEERALQLCRTKVSQRGLPMTVVAAEMQWDRRKLTFYYTASARVDFRDLVKELFRLYKTRIWMCHLSR